MSEKKERPVSTKKTKPEKSFTTNNIRSKKGVVSIENNEVKVGNSKHSKKKS